MATEEIDVVTGELVPSTGTRTLFRTDDPVEVLAAARTVADAFKEALDAGGMVQRIGQSEHVKIDGWQTLGGMLGVAPHVVWSRRIEDGWEARAEARTINGAIVGAAEAMCTRSERNWRRSEDYAIRSMAQTRAMSKALSAPLRFIVTLAGRSGTPAEEAIPEEAPYGQEVSPRERAGLQRALRTIYGDDYDDTELVEKLAADAGDYLPRVVARAVMLVAAHRPSRSAVTADAEAGADSVQEQDAPPAGQQNQAAEGVAADNGDEPEP